MISSFVGLSLEEKFASHFGIWIYAAKKLSVRRGIYERLDLVKAAVAGFNRRFRTDPPHRCIRVLVADVMGH